MELTEPTLEAGVGDEVAPTLAHEASADEARRTVGRDLEQDLFDELVLQWWWSRRHASCLNQQIAEPGFFGLLGGGGSLSSYILRT
jgi:hypothetical protein